MYTVLILLSLRQQVKQILNRVKLTKLKMNTYIFDLSDKKPAFVGRMPDIFEIGILRNEICCSQAL